MHPTHWLIYAQALEDAILGIPTHPDGASPKPDHRIAVHEAGHAVSSFFLEDVDAATRASVRPRSGGSLGVTMFGTGDATNLRRAELRDRVVIICVKLNQGVGAPMILHKVILGDDAAVVTESSGKTHPVTPSSRRRVDGVERRAPRNLIYTQVMMLAGKAAEAHILGDASTGAADDVRRAAMLCEAIVKTYGLSKDGAAYTTWVDEFGKRHAIGGEDGDAAVRAELVEAEARAQQLVRDHEASIRALADALVEHETLDAAALKAVVVPAQPPV